MQQESRHLDQIVRFDEAGTANPATTSASLRKQIPPTSGRSNPDTLPHGSGKVSQSTAWMAEPASVPVWRDLDVLAYKLRSSTNHPEIRN
jgi:hypothetical protein